MRSLLVYFLSGLTAVAPPTAYHALPQAFEKTTPADTTKSDHIQDLAKKYGFSDHVLKRRAAKADLDRFQSKVEAIRKQYNQPVASPAPKPAPPVSTPEPVPPVEVEEPEVVEPPVAEEPGVIESPETTPEIIDSPDVEVPETETPEVEVPDVEVPDVEAPEVEAPEVEAPEVETPEVEAPEVEAPEVEVPDSEELSAEELRLFQSSTIVTKSGRTYAQSGDFLLNYSKNIKAISGQYLVAIHGPTPEAVRIGGERFSAKEFAAVMRADPNWKGQTIKLISCNVGSEANGFAQQLANELGVKVIGADGLTWINARGDYWVTKHKVDSRGNTVPGAASRFVEFRPQS